MEQSDGIGSYTQAGRKNVYLIYILYLLSLVVGFSAIVGLIFAYMNKGKGEDWVDSHYSFQIRTFWIGLAASIAGAVLMIVGIGFLVVFAAIIWTIVRCVKGLQLTSRGEAVPDPQTWLI
ncbi:putative membrane protein [Roseibium hamelinense]|uniref:Putative membrane protein n=1 Tax=Roseibium hamelinense TaxID=150831 RepID=A0A562T3P6_9HYPH|nr:DUF4870 domain-containing protein [Roseibium hamelinense]MTI43350.1 hypothetical protein [Roseibium hamelinense]TWI87550.1 putative membrane protein [Roseibium hamelinense]